MSDLEVIQGVWRADRKNGRAVIPINGKMFGSKLLYRLDTEQRPKQIDLVHRRPRARPRSTAHGIYSLEGDTLTICWGHHGNRPTEFVANPKAEHFLLVLKRQE